MVRQREMKREEDSRETERGQQIDVKGDLIMRTKKFKLVMCVSRALTQLTFHNISFFKLARYKRIYVMHTHEGKCFKMWYDLFVPPVLK